MLEKIYFENWVGKALAAAVCSLSLIFSWATCVAQGWLIVGSGIEPTVFGIATAIPVACVYFAGVFSMLDRVYLNSVE